MNLAFLTTGAAKLLAPREARMAFSTKHAR